MCFKRALRSFYVHRAHKVDEGRIDTTATMITFLSAQIALGAFSPDSFSICSIIIHALLKPNTAH